jgi:anti-sigma B factor antagonist
MISRRNLDDHTAVIDPDRVLDNSNAHEMTEIIDVVQAEGYRYIILDMSNLQFLSSAGVGSILASVGTARESGGDIILCNISEKILRVLKILDLCEYLTIMSNEESAREVCTTKG